MSIKPTTEGSHFAKCDKCGASVPASRADLHVCNEQVNVVKSSPMKVPEVKAPAVASRKRKASEMSEKEKPIATKKRAPSAYQLYMKEQLKVHSDQSPKAKPKDLMKTVAADWKNLPEDQKKKYKEQAEAAKKAGEEAKDEEVKDAAKDEVKPATESKPEEKEVKKDEEPQPPSPKRQKTNPDTISAPEPPKQP